MLSDDNERAVSPVVGVILTVAISVLLSAVVGSLVFGFSSDINEGSTEQRTGWSFSEDGDSDVNARLTTGSAETVAVRVDGERIKQSTDVDVGETVKIERADITSGDTITLVTEPDDNPRVAGRYDVTEAVSINTTPSVSGTVRLNPRIDGANVIAFDANGTRVATGTTDADGNYSLNADGIASVSATVSGFESSETENPLYTSKNKAVNNNTTLSFDFDETKTIKATANGSEISVIYAGTGTETDPHQIGTLEQLQAINKSNATRSQSYELINDVDASRTQSWNNGFRPIGNGQTKFDGSLDGQGHTVSGLTVNTRAGPSGIRGGLVGYVGSNGAVRSIAVEDADVDIGFNAGVIAGVNDGVVTGARASGTADGVSSIGGIAGSNQGRVSNSVSDVQVTGSLNSETAQASNQGGLVGINGGRATIETSYAVGSVNGEQKVGGLAGRHEGNIEQSYATATVAGETEVGGLTGTDGKTESGSYWDVEASTQAGSGGSASGLTTSEMQGDAAKSNMNGFDFDTNWRVSDGSYPELVD
jgi:FlaG/FlaF family flagellin (archaellin)